MDTKILGTVIAPESPSLWDDEKDVSQWLAFMNIDGLIVDGYGVIDGRGKSWWDQSCKYHPHLVNIISTVYLLPTKLFIL